MRYIDLESWPRRQHFEFFSSFDHPHAGMCANVELTSFYRYVKDSGTSMNVAIVYSIARAANAIPEFRQRIRDGKVVEHEIVHPATTILVDDDRFSFCQFEYESDYAAFAAAAVERIAYVKEHLTMEDPPGRDDLLFMTAIPWVSFTGFMHPMHMEHTDSFPRIAWGKFFQEGESLKMPLGVQAHHALADGIHMARFYEKVQGYFDRPESVLTGEGEA
jgi:chloramphenicol O-acetyltransferase type A